MKLTPSKRSFNVDIKMLNDECNALLKQIKILREENYNLKKHLELKDEKIIEQRIQINALEKLMDNWSKYYETK